MKISHRLMTSIQAGVLGLALITGVGACTALGHGNESTADACNNIKAKFVPLMAGMTASLSPMTTSPDASADAQQQAITTFKSTFTQLAQVMRDEAGKVKDSSFASALKELADAVTAATAKIKTFDDLTSNDLDKIDDSKVSKYCPELSATTGN